MWKFFLFLIINFLALGIGSWLMGNPATNEWYNGLNKAPWTPPGWVFGAAWFTVMFCFAVYMFKGASLFPAEKLNMLYVLFAVQFVLNVLWNPIFFRWHFVAPGLIIISLLAIVMKKSNGMEYTLGITLCIMAVYSYFSKCLRVV